jgi:putative transposase
MPIRKAPLVPGEFYHLYNRGNSKQKIFRSSSDYERFTALLYLANTTQQWEVRKIERNQVFDFDRGEQYVAIGAYCLMPNHFHILLTPLVDNGVQKFMLKLSTAYSMYFNTKHHRTGSLFEGRFKSEHVDGDRYLKYLFSYIHLNPVKLFQSDWREIGLSNVADAQIFLNSYQYSSYIDTKIERAESAILKRRNYPDYFETPFDLDKEILEWLAYRLPKDDQKKNS